MRVDGWLSAQAGSRDPEPVGGNAPAQVLLIRQGVPNATRCVSYPATGPQIGLEDKASSDISGTDLIGSALDSRCSGCGCVMLLRLLSREEPREREVPG
jgi:hypothetical protein